LFSLANPPWLPGKKGYLIDKKKMQGVWNLANVMGGECSIDGGGSLTSAGYSLFTTKACIIQ